MDGGETGGKKQSKVWFVALSLFVLFLIVISVYLFNKMGSKTTSTKDSAAIPTGKLIPDQEMVDEAEKVSDDHAQQGLYSAIDLALGNGKQAENGNTVSVNYVGTLLDGTEFDNSYKRGEPITFVLGAGQVIKGWDMGILGMRVGGKRKLTIPPDLGYGDKEMGPIPANSMLIFEVELVDVK